MMDRPQFVWKKSTWYNRWISRRRGQPEWVTYFQEGAFFPVRVAYWDQEIAEPIRRKIEADEVTPKAGENGCIRAYDWRKFFSGKF